MFYSKASVVILKKNLESLELKAKNLETEVKDLSRTNADLRETIRSERETIGELKEKLDEQSKLLREQNEADILLNALKAVGIIKDDKPVDYMAESNRLMDQNGAILKAGQTYFLSRPRSNVFGGLF